MDYLFLQDFLVSYSLPTLIIAFVVCLVRLILNKFFGTLPKLIKSYIPFLLAMILYFVYDVIFVIKQIIITSQTFYGGLISGSLSAIIFSTITKICKGRPVGSNATILLIEGILNDYVTQEALSKTAIEIEQALSSNEGTVLEQQVINTLTYNCLELSSTDIIYLTKLILSTAKTIQKTKD